MWHPNECSASQRGACSLHCVTLTCCGPGFVFLSRSRDVAQAVSESWTSLFCPCPSLQQIFKNAYSVLPIEMHQYLCMQWHNKDTFFEFSQVFLEEQTEWFIVSVRPRTGDYSLCFPAVLRMNFVILRRSPRVWRGPVLCCPTASCITWFIAALLKRYCRRAAFAMCVLDCLAAVSCYSGFLFLRSQRLFSFRCCFKFCRSCKRRYCCYMSGVMCEFVVLRQSASNPISCFRVETFRSIFWFLSLMGLITFIKVFWWIAREGWVWYRSWCFTQELASLLFSQNVF